MAHLTTLPPSPYPKPRPTRLARMTFVTAMTAICAPLPRMTLVTAMTAIQAPPPRATVVTAMTAICAH